MKCVISRLFRLNSLLTGVLVVAACLEAHGSDIAPMTWSASQRSGWINVTSPGAYTDETTTPNATGNGTTDDTAAIQGVLNYLSDHDNDLLHKTVYFPAGTYKITSTLHLTERGTNMIGCGINTVIKWAGPAGKAMLWHDGASPARFVGFVWDGGGSAGPAVNTSVGASCAYEEYSSQGYYMTAIRHENESFRNFTIQYGTYLTDNYNPNGMPPAAIISGFNSLAQPCGEVTIFNCYFTNCGEAIHNAVDIFNNFMWVVDGCEFDNNGVGFDGGFGGCYIVANSHFQNSWVCDVNGGYGLHLQRLTSTGSQMFFNGAGSSTVLEDCWVDSWAATSGAVLFNRAGQMGVFDCNFTNPPAGALGPIWLYEDVPYGQDLFLSNNNAPAFPPGAGILHQQVATNIDWVPNGSLSGNMTSASQTFIQSAAVNDSTHILDVTSSTFNPTGATPTDLSHDWTSSIQAAINAAAAANNGSVVYLPGGFYGISSTLTLTGGNYTVEGEGINTEVCWIGGSNATMMAVTTPQNITVHQIQLAAALNTLAASQDPSNLGYGRPVCDPTTVTGLLETSTGASSAVYDNVICTAYYYGNPFASNVNITGPGLSLSGLPAGSTVYIPVLSSALTINDCGPAKIFSKMAYMGLVNVAGATQPKTGQLGLMVAEGGQSDGRSGSNTGLYNFTINDNQSLTVGAYYSEQGGNDVQLLRGSGTTPGHVAIQGLVSSPTPDSITVNVDSYVGRLFYGDAGISGGVSGDPVQIDQSGANPIDMIFADDFFYGSAQPTFSLSSGANLISTLNEYGSGTDMTDTPNPLTAASLTSMASSLDDFRQLSALNLNVEYGMGTLSGLVGYWKLDETTGPAADSSMSGYTGTWENGPTPTTDHPLMMPYADPGSMSFNGANQYINMGNPAGLPTGHAPRTICGWGKASNTNGGWRWIAAFGSPSTSEAMFIGMNGTSLDGGAYGDDLIVPNFWDNNWHFIVLTYDGTTAKLYADGALVASDTRNWNLVPSACYIGEQVNNASEFWNGQIDDVRIYNRALSAQEIAGLYAPAGEVLPIAVTGYTQDVVYGPAAGDTTASAWFQGYHLYAAGQGSNGGIGGLPNPNMMQSASHPNTIFQFQPYNASNILPLQGNSGTLTLTTPASYSQISVLLVNAGSGGMSVTLNFSDGSQTVVSYSSLAYWAYADPATTGGSLAAAESILVGDGTTIDLGEYDIPLSATDAAKTLTSVTFTGINYSYGTLGILGLSGCTD